MTNRPAPKGAGRFLRGRKDDVLFGLSIAARTGIKSQVIEESNLPISGKLGPVVWLIQQRIRNENKVPLGQVANQAISSIRSNGKHVRVAPNREHPSEG